MNEGNKHVIERKFEDLIEALADIPSAELGGFSPSARRIIAMTTPAEGQGDVVARTESAHLSAGAILFAELGRRLVYRIMEAADMSLPDATDVELSLCRIIHERDSLKAAAARFVSAIDTMFKTEPEKHKLPDEN